MHQGLIFLDEGIERLRDFGIQATSISGYRQAHSEIALLRSAQRIPQRAQPLFIPASPRPVAPADQTTFERAFFFCRRPHIGRAHAPTPQLYDYWFSIPRPIWGTAQVAQIYLERRRIKPALY